jgi:hypothetical protein
LVWPLCIAALFSGDSIPSCLSPLDGFITLWCSTPFGYEATQAKRWLKSANHDPIFMVFLQSELTRRQKGNASSGRSSGTADGRRGILGELTRIYEADSAVVPKGLFGRGAQLARDIGAHGNRNLKTSRIGVKLMPHRQPEDSCLYKSQPQTPEKCMPDDLAPSTSTRIGSTSSIFSSRHTKTRSKALLDADGRPMASKEEAALLPWRRKLLWQISHSSKDARKSVGKLVTRPAESASSQVTLLPSLWELPRNLPFLPSVVTRRRNPHHDCLLIPLN